MWAEPRAHGPRDARLARRSRADARLPARGTRNRAGPGGGCRGTPRGGPLRHPPLLPWGGRRAQRGRRGWGDPVAGLAGGPPGAAWTTPPGKPGAPQLLPNGKLIGDTTGLPQFENGVEFQPRSPDYRVSFSLEDADLPELVRVIANLTGKRFIFGGKVKTTGTPNWIVSKPSICIGPPKPY